MSKSEYPRQHSALVHDGADRAPNRSMLRAVGFQDADFQKPVVGIASTWSMLTPCNMHIDELARHAGTGADAAGGKSIIFGTITVADGISMGTQGMRYSLVSREVIADSIETVCGAEGFDGLVAIGGCDKNNAISFRSLKRLANMRRANSTRRPSPKLRSALFPAPAPAAVCTQRIQWPPPSRRSA